jgi:pyruvate dehydrogenase E1 component alpha subunit
VVVVYFGEGAASEGDVHEAMNLAGVRRAPVIFVLQDNGWAISTPVSKQSATESFALRAAGYDFPGELVDVNDLLAMHEAGRHAVERARAGEGPTLIEARTYRLAPHNTSDDNTRYVDPAELEQAQARDPVVRLRAYLESRDLIDDEREAAMRDEIKAELGEAVERMEREAERMPTELLYDNVYADPPPRLIRQRSAALGEPGGNG